MQIGIGRRETAYGQAQRGRRTVRQAMGIRAAKHTPRKTVPVAYVAAEGKTSVGKNRALQSETGAHVRPGAVAASGGPSEEGKSCASLVSVLLGGQRGITKDP